MRKNFHPRLILCAFAIFLVASESFAQMEGMMIPGHGYVIMKNGDTVNGSIYWRMKYVENNPCEIKFTPKNGSQQILNASDILGLSISDNSHYVTMPSMKKGVPVLYNRLMDGRLKVFQNRSSATITKETVAEHTQFSGIEFNYTFGEGLTVGPSFITSYEVLDSKTRYSSYYIIKDQGAFQKIDKDNYDSVFQALFGDCEAIQKELEKNPDLRKFKNFMILTEVYNQLCR